MSSIDLHYVEPVTGYYMIELERKTTPVNFCHCCKKWYEVRESDFYYLHELNHSVIYMKFVISNGRIEQNVTINDNNPGRLGCLCP